MIAAFARDNPTHAASIDSACFGVAGPVLGEIAQLTNAPWHVDVRLVAKTFGIGRAALLNDLEAMAYGVPMLEPSEVQVLQEGQPIPGGNMAVIAAGTGLGEALIHSVGGRLIPSRSEAGHADFAARTEREIDLMRALTARFGRAEVEEVLSGRGLVNLHRITHTDGGCLALEDESSPDAPAEISKAALERRCGGCVEALGLFVDAYGAEAGNLALRTVSTGGLFVGGGIALKILPALVDGRFMRAFRDKAPLADMVARMPVAVILNPDVGMLGAAVYAAQL
jgi:glucokinase